jgi:hypothetical protein
MSNNIKLKHMSYYKSIVLFICLTCTSFNAWSASTFNPKDSTAISIEKPRPIRFLPSSRPHINELSAWFGYSYDSMRLWGKTRNTTLTSFGLQYNRKLLNFYGHTVKYTFRFIFSKYDYPEFKVGHPRNTLSGYGISPLGFQINFRENHLIQPFFNSSGGIMILDGPFPDQRGKKFNFTFSAGGGLEFKLTQSFSFSLGIKFHHLSNFQRGQINPGVDSGLLYSSITIF